MIPPPDFSAFLAMQQAQALALRAALEAALKELGLESIEGVPVSDWISQRVNVELQNVLIGMENLDPAAAAATQEHIEQLLKKFLGGSQGKS